MKRINKKPGNERLPKDSSVLLVVAHPDDEAFGPGGTLALLAQTNTVTLICVTDGGLKERKAELLESAEILGVHEVIFLDYADGSLCNALYHEVAGKIQEVVDRVRPAMFLTFEPRGISGHIDHMAVTMITSYVFRENKAIKELWQFAELEWKFERPWRNKYFIYFPPGYRKEELDVEIDVSRVYSQQVKAMRAHKSQKKDAELIILARKLLPKREYFLVKKR